MRLADETCHLVLKYVDAIGRNGYTLSAGDVNAYAERVGRKARRQPTYREQIQELALSAKGIAPAESPLMWLYRVGWLALLGESSHVEDDEAVEITPLGRAALVALDESVSVDRESPAASIALDKDDPIALAKVIGKIADLGPAALVDRYFREEAFLPIVQRTEITKILMGPDPKGRVAAIGQALADYSVDRPLEVRVDAEDAFHDRYVIPEEGPIWALGTSVSGVGDRHSAMVEIKDATVIRGMKENFRAAWEAAGPLNPAAEKSRSSPAEKKSASESSAEVEVDDGEL